MEWWCLCLEEYFARGRKRRSNSETGKKRQGSRHFIQLKNHSFLLITVSLTPGSVTQGAEYLLKCMYLPGLWRKRSVCIYQIYGGNSSIWNGFIVGRNYLPWLCWSLTSCCVGSLPVLVQQRPLCGPSGWSGGKLLRSVSYSSAFLSHHDTRRKMEEDRDLPPENLAPVV